MPQRDNLVRPNDPINEKTSAFYVLTFKDENGDNITPSTATYTLYNTATASTIGGLENITVPGTGAVRTIEIPPSANVIVDDSLFSEEHRLYVPYTFQGGAKKGSVEIQVIVVNMGKES
jgi:hypothetical protein